MTEFFLNHLLFDVNQSLELRTRMNWKKSYYTKQHFNEKLPKFIRDIQRN